MDTDDRKSLKPRTKLPMPTARSAIAPNAMTAVRMPQKSEVGRFHEYRGVLLLFLGAIVIWLNLTFMIPMIMGAIFAAVLYPLMTSMARWRVSAVWKSLLLTLAFAISFLLPIGAIIYIGAEEALAKIQQFQDAGVDATRLSPASLIQVLGLKPLIARLADVSPVSEAQLRQLSTRGIATAGEWLIRALQGLLADIPAALFSMFITLLTLFFLLIDGKKALRFIRDNSIFGPLQTDRIFQAAFSLCYSVVVASIAAGAAQAFCITLSCLIAGLPGAILIGLVAFVLSFLPVLGTAPVTCGLALYAIIRGDPFQIAIFVAFVAIVAVVDNVVRPMVLKGGASLHPLIGFVAAFGALDVIGFYGVFIGPVAAGLFFTMLPMITRTYRAPTTR